MNRPIINVTPLIDVLLVLLIIFMVVAPLKPSSFKARIPAEVNSKLALPPHPDTLVVTVNEDLSMNLNAREDVGTVNDTAELIERLHVIFQERIQNGNISELFGLSSERPFNDRVERTVFIKAPRNVSYGNIAKVVDAVKLAGAFPISLQIDGLE
jgi:biopolymer transport protein ExbD